MVIEPCQVKLSGTFTEEQLAKDEEIDDPTTKRLLKLKNEIVFDDDKTGLLR